MKLTRKFPLITLSMALSLSACRAGSPRDSMGSGLYRADSTAGDSAAVDAASRLQQRTAANALPATCPASMKIIGGKSVEAEDLAAAAAVKIWIKGTRFCTGTLVGSRQLVTAAHCFKDVLAPEDIKLGFGVDGQAQDEVKVKSFLVHPAFKGVLADAQGFKQMAMNDVAVITFEGSPTETLRPVGIASSESLYPGISVIVAGFGSYGSEDRSRRPLSQVSLELASIRPEFKELQLKTGETKGACFGDSGGPTFIQADKGQCLLLVGSTTGPGRNTDYTCESGGGTLMDLTRYRGWLSCAFSRLGAPLSDSFDEEKESCAAEQN